MSKISKLLKSLTLKDQVSSNNSPSILSKGVDNVVNKVVKEQEAPIFTRKNVLVQEFIGEAPPVFSNNFGTVIIGIEEVDEKGRVHELPNLREDNNTIRMQDQYGYNGEDATKVEKEEFEDDIPDDMGIKLVLPEEKTFNILTPEQQFIARWGKIKEELKSTDENVIIKE